VQLRQEFRAYAGAAMEVVGVLRDEKLQLAEPLELDEAEVGCVGSDLSRWSAPPWRRQAGVAPRPHPIGAAKVGDAGVGTDACPRKGDRVPGLDDPSSDCLYVLVEALPVSHAVSIPS
jgi:hypothetical protein